MAKRNENVTNEMRLKTVSHRRAQKNTEEEKDDVIKFIFHLCLTVLARQGTSVGTYPEKIRNTVLFQGFFNFCVLLWEIPRKGDFSKKNKNKIPW